MYTGQAVPYHTIVGHARPGQTRQAGSQEYQHACRIHTNVHTYTHTHPSTPTHNYNHTERVIRGVCENMCRSAFCFVECTPRVAIARDRQKSACARFEWHRRCNSQTHWNCHVQKTVSLFQCIAWARPNLSRAPCVDRRSGDGCR